MNMEQNMGEQLDCQEFAYRLAMEVKNSIENAKTKDKKMFGYQCAKVFGRNNIDYSSRYELMKKIGAILGVDREKYEIKDGGEKSIMFNKKIQRSAEWDRQREEWRAGQNYEDSDIE